MENKFLLWIWYYHELPTMEQMEAENNRIIYSRLYEKYKSCYKDYFDINPNDLKLSAITCEQVILYYERSMRNENTTV